MEELSFGDLFPGLDWSPGRGCFLKFAGPNHSNISFYASSDFDPGVEKIKLAIKWDRGADGVFVKTMNLNSYMFNPKVRPLCGHAVNSEKGETNVFMLVRDLEADRFTRVPVISIKIPTVEVIKLSDFMLEEYEVPLNLVSQEGLKSMALIGHEDNFAQGYKVNANVWLGDHRNIVLVDGRGAAIYNAKTDSLEDGPLKPLYWKWFLAGRATQHFVKFIGCKNF